MSFQQSMAQHFPGALPGSDFVRRSLEVLTEHGFDAMNAIACVGVCRDELTQPLVMEIRTVWGESFNFSSLAGMLFLGKTGFLAAQHHAPNAGGRERYVFFALPHIGVNAEGEMGSYTRPGRGEVTSACGALVAFQKELQSGRLTTETDRDDLEQSFLKQHLIHQFRYGEVPELVRLTKLAHAVILEDLERMIELTVDTTHSDYAVYTGIQIHGPNRDEFVWPRASYAVVDRTWHPLTLTT